MYTAYGTLMLKVVGRASQQQRLSALTLSHVIPQLYKPRFAENNIHFIVTTEPPLIDKVLLNMEPSIEYTENEYRNNFLPEYIETVKKICQKFEKHAQAETLRQQQQPVELIRV